MSLFDGVPESPSPLSKRPTQARPGAPLAERMRPRTLDDYVGQEHLLGPGKPLRVQIDRDDPGSMIFWGPPGVGKTTLAKIIAETTKASFVEFSAVLSGIKDQAGDGYGRPGGRDALAHDPLCRRNPPLQQGATGRILALRRAGHNPPHRSDN